MNRHIKSAVFHVLIFSLYTAQVSADVYALKDGVRTHTRIADELTYSNYDPTYEIVIAAVAGDILRLAGQIEVSENEHERNKAWAYLSVRLASSQTRTRVSSYAYQITDRNNNHHMPLYLYGYYAVPSSGTYVVEIMARHYSPNNTQVLIEYDDNATSDFGQIIAELFRPYGSAQDAIDDGARLLVNTDRAAFGGGFEVGVNDPEAEYLLPAAEHFSVVADDILRAQSAATAEYLNEQDRFGLDLHIYNYGGSLIDRLSVSTENIISPPLFRFTLQNDGFYKATDARDVQFIQRVLGGNGEGYYLNDDQTDLVAMHFSNRSGDYLLSSQHVTTATTATFDSDDPAIVLLTASGSHQMGDTIRVQSQAQMEIVDGYGGAACWTRIEIYENSVLEYQSMRDQRYMRNSTNEQADHQFGAMSPFALYVMQASGTYEVKLVSDCSSSAGVEIEAIHYGRHLDVDHFRPD